MTKEDIFEAYSGCIMPTYTKVPRIFVKGKGMKLVDIDGKEYVDFFPGWGVGNVGHCHSAVLCAIRDQLGKLIHLPNNYFHPAQAKLAAELIRQTFPGKVFFANSGAEANEAAIKLARAWGASGNGAVRYEIITFQDAFHGRTLATLTATGQAKYQKGFEPLVEGFVTNVAFNDFEALRSAKTDKTVAVMMELVQGEGGVRVAEPDFVRKVRDFCTQNRLLLIVDEVQTGMGRTVSELRHHPGHRDAGQVAGRGVADRLRGCAQGYRGHAQARDARLDLRRGASCLPGSPGRLQGDPEGQDAGQRRPYGAVSL